MKPFYILRNEAGDEGDGGGGTATLPDGGGSAAVPPSGGGSLITPSEPQAPAPAGGTPAPAGSPPNPQGGAAFDFRTLVGDDGNFTADFRTKLPEEMKGLEKFSSPKQLLEGYANLQQLLGKKAEAVVIPGVDASREEWAPILKRMGVPDSPEGYGLKVPAELPEGVSVDPAELAEFSKTAHELGLTPQQVAKLQEYDLSRAAKMATGSLEQAQAIEAQEFAKQSEILKQAWGNGPDAKAKSLLAERAALTFGFTADEVASDPLFRNARFVQTLARAGAAMSEDTLVKGADITSSGGLKAKASDVINNPSNPMYKKYWSGDEGTVEQVRAWMKAG